MVLNSMQNIKQIYNKLNCSNSDKIQIEGIKLAKEITNLSLLIQPDDMTMAWKNCAIVLSEKSDEELAPYLADLLKWLQDINWEGALIILNRLKHYYDERLATSIENAVADSKKMPREYGLMWLDYLSELLDNVVIINKLSNKTVVLLQKHYHNWTFWYKT